MIQRVVQMGLRPFDTNLLFYLLAATGLAFSLFPFWLPISANVAQGQFVWIGMSLAIALMVAGILVEAQQGLTVQTVALIGTLVGLNTAIRVVENIVPLPGGFSPVFVLIILVGYSFGARLGFLMGALTMLVSGPLTAGGFGPWTPYQMLAAGWIGMMAAWLPGGRYTLIWLVVFGVLTGWFFGALTNLSYWPFAFSAPDLGWAPGLAPGEALRRYFRFYLITSLAWDGIRSVGNGVLLALVGLPLLEALERFRRRAHVVWEIP